MFIGCHLSIAKGFYEAGLTAVSIDANTFQFFTRNPRGGNAKEIDPSDVIKLRTLMAEHRFGPLFAHASYTMNLCSDKQSIRNYAKMIFKEDLERLKQIPESHYIFHPGSHVGQGIDQGVEFIAEALNEALDADLEGNSVILLEGMSGKGSEIGKTLEELRWIIDAVHDNKRLGVCLDTCHLYSAGYDIVNDLEGVLKSVDTILGLKRLRAIHLNDSKLPFNSGNDRHEVLGAGTLGIDAIQRIINHPLLKDLPMNLETPNELDGYKKEIQMIRQMRLVKGLEK